MEIYNNGIFTLEMDENKKISFYFDGKCYPLSSYPYEPSTFIRVSYYNIVISPAYDIGPYLIDFVQQGKKFHSITRAEYDINGLCKLLAAVILDGKRRYSIDEAENLMREYERLFKD